MFSFRCIVRSYFFVTLLLALANEVTASSTIAPQVAADSIVLSTQARKFNDVDSAVSNYRSGPNDVQWDLVERAGDGADEFEDECDIDCGDVEFTDFSDERIQELEEEAKQGTPEDDDVDSITDQLGGINIRSLQKRGKKAVKACAVKGESLDYPSAGKLIKVATFSR